MLALARPFADLADALRRVGHQRVDQGRLSDAGGADEDSHAIAEPVTQRGDRFVESRSAADDDGQPDRGVRRHQIIGWLAVALGQAQHRLDAGVVRRHQTPVDQPRLRRRVDRGADDDELVGIRHEHALDRVGVVGTSSKHGLPGGDAHDPRERVGSAAEVADDVDRVTHHHGPTTELAGSHRDDQRVVVQQGAVAPSIDADNAAERRIFVLRTQPASRPRAAALSAEAILVIDRLAGQRVAPWPSTAAVHNAANPGSVFAVVAMFSTCTPLTTSPTTAAAIAIR